jgi:hypothetical protein
MLPRVLLVPDFRPGVKPCAPGAWRPPHAPGLGVRKYFTEEICVPRNVIVLSFKFKVL